MDKVLWVGAGGFVGSVLRYLLSGYVQQLSGSVDFPYGTFAVNLIGCFFIGLLSSLAELRGVFTAEIRALLLTGILGGLTTFSTFGNETMNLFREGQTALALLNIGLSIGGGLAAVWSGHSLVYAVWR